MEIKSCFICPVRETLLLEFTNRKTRFININECTTTQDDINFIKEANRRYLKQLFDTNKSGLHKFDGCLPIVCLDIAINNQDSKHSLNKTSPKYLINYFIALMEILFQDYFLNKSIFQRDTSLIPIPTSVEKMQTLMVEMTDILTQHGLQGENGDNHFSYVFQIILQQLFTLENKCLKKTEKMNKNLKKISGTKGIGDIHDMLNSIKNLKGMQESLSECAETIHKCISNNRNNILSTVMNEENEKMMAVKQVFQHITNDADVKIYSNLNISLDVMFSAIGEVFNVLFLSIMPQQSMLECLLASFYHTAVLNEMNLLTLFSQMTQMPILFKLIYSCFKTNCDEAYQKMAENYLLSNHTSVLNQINRLNGDLENDLQAVCVIASKSDLQNTEYMDALFYVLNSKKNTTYHFYVITIASLYTQTVCVQLNKDNKLNNTKLFARPLYKMFNLFYVYVNSLDRDTVLSSQTFDSFSQIYKQELDGCLAEFIKNVEKIT